MKKSFCQLPDMLTQQPGIALPDIHSSRASRWATCPEPAFDTMKSQTPEVPHFMLGPSRDEETTVSSSY